MQDGAKLKMRFTERFPFFWKAEIG